MNMQTEKMTWIRFGEQRKFQKDGSNESQTSTCDS